MTPAAQRNGRGQPRHCFGRGLDRQPGKINHGFGLTRGQKSSDDCCTKLFKILDGPLACPAQDDAPGATILNNKDIADAPGIAFKTLCCPC